MKILKHNTAGAYNCYGYLANDIRYDPSTVIESYLPVVEAVDWEVDRDKKGGIIVVSTDVNAVELDPNKVINWVKQKAATLHNRIHYTKMIDRITKSKDEVYAWTIGKYLHGRYKSKTGDIFDENSLSIEFLNIPSETLLEIADELCRDFKQETVLVKDYAKDTIYFVNGKEE